MLKETKTEETIAFFVTFSSLVAFHLGGAWAPWAPLDTPMGTQQKERVLSWSTGGNNIYFISFMTSTGQNFTK